MPSKWNNIPTFFHPLFKQTFLQVNFHKCYNVLINTAHYIILFGLFLIYFQVNSRKVNVDQHKDVLEAVINVQIKQKIIPLSCCEQAMGFKVPFWFHILLVLFFHLNVNTFSLLSFDLEHNWMGSNPFFSCKYLLHVWKLLNFHSNQEPLKFFIFYKSLCVC